MKDIIWVEIYEIAVDDMIAMPARYVESVCDAITKRHVRIVTEVQAKQINEAFVSRNNTAKRFLEERLAERWQLIERWKHETNAVDADMPQVPPKVSQLAMDFVAKGGQIMLPFECGDASVTFPSRWKFAQMVEDLIDQAA